jgi:hypothetical protein
MLCFELLLSHKPQIDLFDYTNMDILYEKQVEELNLDEHFPDNTESFNSSALKRYDLRVEDLQKLIQDINDLQDKTGLRTRRLLRKLLIRWSMPFSIVLWIVAFIAVYNNNPANAWKVSVGMLVVPIFGALCGCMLEPRARALHEHWLAEVEKLNVQWSQEKGVRIYLEEVRSPFCAEVLDEDGQMQNRSPSTAPSVFYRLIVAKSNSIRRPSHQEQEKNSIV